MANIDEAFAALSDVQSVSVNENVDFVVDSYLRVISIPVRGVVLGVEGDKDVNRVTFRMSRTYKGVDMSQFQIRINYANANNELNYFKVTEITVSDDEIVFVWVVGADAVAYVGNVEFVVRFIKLSGSNIIQELNTTLATAKSLIGLSVDGEISPVQREDLLAHFYNEIDAYSETKKNEILDSIPEDYTALANEVDELKSDLEDIKEPLAKSNADTKDTLYVTDSEGNVICSIDKDGVHSVGFDGKNLALNDVLSTYDDTFYISDSEGNVIFKADKNGVSGLNLDSSTSVLSPYKGMKLLTIGDSLSAHDHWQKWLVEWLGVTFDNDENINGKDGHMPMAKGGTAIAPTSADSIYMRSLDAKYYADSENGTIIIIYAGQNDSVELGTIDDTPYTEKAVTDASNLTFYSSYMGMIENILADIPSARIYLMTQMPVRLEIGMTGTKEPYVGVVRFPDMASVLSYEARRYKKVEAIRAIAEKYSLPCIDLWKDSGINDYNSSYWYGAVGGTCGQVHPNNTGYKRMAEVTVAKMY